MDISKYVEKLGIKSIDERILNLVRDNPGIPIGVMINRLRNVERSIVAGKLQSMVDDGTLTAIRTPLGKRGRKSLKFHITEK